MEKRGYFGSDSLKKHSKIELLENFFSTIGSPAQIVGMLRKSNYRSSPLTDKRALSAWAVCVTKVSKNYKQNMVDLKFLQELAKLSVPN